MVFRRSFAAGSRPRASFRRAKRDMVWVPWQIRASVDETGTAFILFNPTGWSPDAGNNWDTGTLLRIVGWLGWRQTVAATSGEQPFWAGAVVLQDVAATSMSPVTLSQYDDRNVLHTLGGPLASSTTLASQSVLEQTRQLDIRVKRKVNSANEIALILQVGTDTAAAPAMDFVGIGRCLIAR
jgi:hypothetical protein